MRRGCTETAESNHIERNQEDSRNRSGPSNRPPAPTQGFSPPPPRRQNISLLRLIFRECGFDRRRRCCFLDLNFPSLQILRNTSQLGNQSLALRTYAQMSRGSRSPIGREFAVQVGHQFFRFDRMHDLVHMASPSARVSSTLPTSSLTPAESAIFRSGSRCPFSAIRDRNSRERTVFTGNFINSAISA